MYNISAEVHNKTEWGAIFISANHSQSNSFGTWILSKKRPFCRGIAPTVVDLSNLQQAERAFFVMARTPWTLEQIEILKEHYSQDVVDLEYLSRLFGKLRSNISKKAGEIGLTNRHRPVPEERARLRDEGLERLLERKREVRKNIPLRVHPLARVTTGAEGNRYNLLTAIRWIEMSQSHKSIWEFRCDCGNTYYAALSEVKYGHVKSCGCLHRRKGRVPGNKLPEGESSLRGLYTSRRKGARDRNLSWNIPEEVFRQIITKPCFYCGAPPNQIHLSHKTSNGSCVYNGLDRVDNSRGYELDNVVPCCGTCNIAKATKSQQVFFEWITRVYEHSIKLKV